MGFPRFVLYSFVIISLLFPHFCFSQIIFKELPGYKFNYSEKDLLDITETRSVISLDGKWQVYAANDKEQKKIVVDVPSIFEGDGILVFEKAFSLSKEQISNNEFKIYFLGLNYSADISVNNVIIYRHTGGRFPFNIDLPKDIIKFDRYNILSVKLNYKADAENTIPVKQGFLLPKNYGGIFGDIYLQLFPNIFINDPDISYKYDPRSNKVKFVLSSKIENKDFVTKDSLGGNDLLDLKIVFQSASGGSSSVQDQSFQLNRNKEKSLTEYFELSSPVLWSPSNPQSYNVSFNLYRNGRLIDIVNRKVSVYSITPSKESLLFNGSNFTIEGVTYIPSNYEYGSMLTIDQMEKDIRLIKESGFNCIRFSKIIPNPYYLVLCEKVGLLAFVELPLNLIPGKLSRDPNFIQRSQNYLNNFIKSYKRYSVIGAVGLGSSYLPGVESQINLLNSLADLTKKQIHALTYASFAKFNISRLDNLDLYGLEFINALPNQFHSQILDLKTELGAGSVFISDATYTVNAGNSDGYVNKYTYEAQASYFDQVIDYCNSTPLSGYFLNTMFDYRGEYSSLITGYNKENIYHIGLVGEDRENSRLALKVVSAKLHNSEKVTIPIGSKKDDAPMIFIVFGIVLAILFSGLINSGRKFREDTSRALLRPYNFFADVRDQRLISGMQSNILAVLIAAVSGLMISNLLYYLRDNLFFEKTILAFGSHGILKTINYLAWHPVLSILWLSVASFIILVFLSILVKAGAFFVRNRVYFSSAYFTVIWSFLPLMLLIPVGIILYRVLSADVGNTYVYLALILFTLWIFYRLMKGIYVIFDVNAGSVYFYSLLLIALVFTSTIIYYEMSNSVIEYLQITLKLFNIL
ncbi:MAG: glycoside hydrolase family 2 TIM barrel-domain containing protein [Ignavibacteriaceae bacterium]|nr:glycoside hydrolase family 2 TIM barrel-domain containing protein [Ignavibacteriaceae bacterium]